MVISHGPQTIPYLGVGFPLRCFQRLSFPDIATGRCHWCDSPQTRGQFISVLSSFIPHFHGAQTISSPVPSTTCVRARAVASYPYEQSVSKTDSSTYESEYLSTQVVTGSNPIFDTEHLLSWSFDLRSSRFEFRIRIPQVAGALFWIAI